MGVTPSFTSERKRLYDGTLFPVLPNQTRLSLISSSTRASEYLHEYPLGGRTVLPLGVLIGNILFGFAGPTEKSLLFHGPRGSLSGFLYRESASPSRGRVNSSVLERFFAKQRIYSWFSEKCFFRFTGA